MAQLTRSWTEMQTFYQRSCPFPAMLDLINAIEQSPFAPGLFPWQSMHTLCITQTPVDYPYNGPYLRVTPVSKTHIELRYSDTHVKDNQWHRLVPNEEAFNRLERFLDELHWFGKSG